MIGRIIGRLTVVSLAPRKSGNAALFWHCQCTCGNMVIHSTSRLKFGETKSCGCYGRELSAAGRKTHGHTSKGKRTQTYISWHSMFSRCREKNPRTYKNYGSRGITVCERWNKFENFIADMGERPEGHTLDRINNDGNYEPSNCKWSLRKEQCRNRSTSRFLNYKNETLTIAEWAEKLGIKYHTIISRLGKGLPTEDCLNTHVVKRNRIYGKKKKCSR